MTETTVQLTPDLDLKLRRATGKRTTRAAVRAALNRVADEGLAIKKLPVQVQQSERELRAGKGRSFKTARAAMKWLES